MNWIQRETTRTAQIKVARATETVATAQAALDQAQARYDGDGGKSAAYDIAAAQDRAEAAKERETIQRLPISLCCQELRAEWRENGGVY